MTLEVSNAEMFTLAMALRQYKKVEMSKKDQELVSLLEGKMMIAQKGEQIRIMLCKD